MNSVRNEVTAAGLTVAFLTIGLETVLGEMWIEPHADEIRSLHRAFTETKRLSLPREGASLGIVFF